MKSIYIILMTLLLVVPCMAELTTNQTAYIQGRNAGFELGILYWQGLGNTTAATAYNEKVTAWNNLMNTSLNNTTEALAQQLKPMPLPNNSWQPTVIKNWDGKSNVWAGTKGAL